MAEPGEAALTSPGAALAILDEVQKEYKTDRKTLHGFSSSRMPVTEINVLCVVRKARTTECGGTRVDEYRIEAHASPVLR